MKTLQRVFRTVVVCYVLLVGTLFMLQRHLIYLADRTDEATQLARAARTGVGPWRAAGGEIIAWRRPSRGTPAAANRLVVFHGNAGSALYRTHFIEGFEGLDEARSGRCISSSIWATARGAASRASRRSWQRRAAVGQLAAARLRARRITRQRPGVRARAR